MITARTWDILLKNPSDCMTKSDIRTAIDSLDEALLKLFARRQGYVRRMAELKRHPDEAFDHDRIETMIARLKARADELGLEGDQAETVWRTLIDWNVAYERVAISERLRDADVNASDVNASGVNTSDDEE